MIFYVFPQNSRYLVLSGSTLSKIDIIKGTGDPAWATGIATESKMRMMATRTVVIFRGPTQTLKPNSQSAAQLFLWSEYSIGKIVVVSKTKSVHGQQ